MTGLSADAVNLFGGLPTFAQACAELLSSGFNALYVELWAEGETTKRKKKSASKTKYTCPSCHVNAWAKPQTALICGGCRETMAAYDGWRVPGHQWPPSSNGVACFTADGALLPLPDWPVEAGTIADCYALNVVGPGAWACPYTEFPLVRFVPGKPARWWRTHICGAKAIAVDGNHALLAGGYQKEANRLALVDLVENGVGEQAPVLAVWTLPLRPLPPSDNERAPVWHRPSLLTGRGDTLHLIDDSVWYRWRVSDLVSS